MFSRFIGVILLTVIASCCKDKGNTIPEEVLKIPANAPAHCYSNSAIDQKEIMGECFSSSSECEAARKTVSIETGIETTDRCRQKWHLVCYMTGTKSNPSLNIHCYPEHQSCENNRILHESSFDAPLISSACRILTAEDFRSFQFYFHPVPPIKKRNLSILPKDSDCNRSLSLLSSPFQAPSITTVLSDMNQTLRVKDYCSQKKITFYTEYKNKARYAYKTCMNDDIYFSQKQKAGAIIKSYESSADFMLNNFCDGERIGCESLQGKSKIDCRERQAYWPDNPTFFADVALSFLKE